MASRDDIFGLAAETRDLSMQGHLDPATLTPKGHLLLQIGQGDIDLDGITPEQRTLIGLDPTMMQNAGAAVTGIQPAIQSIAPPWLTKTADTLIEGAMKVPERFMQGGKDVADVIKPPEATAPTMGPFNTTGSANTPSTDVAGLREGGGVDDTMKFIGGAGSLAFPFGAAAGHIVGEGGAALADASGELSDERLQMRLTAALQSGNQEEARQVQAILALPPAERAERNRAGWAGLGEAAAGAVPGYTMALRAARGLGKIPTPPPSVAPPPPKPPQLALPPASEDFVMIPKEMVRPRTDNALTGQQGPQGALPEAPRDIAVKPYEPPPSILPGRGIPGDVDTIIPRAVEKPSPLPSATDVAQKRAGIDPTVPPDMPSQILGPDGQPVMKPGAKPFGPSVQPRQTLRQQYEEAKLRAGGSEPLRPPKLDVAPREGPPPPPTLAEIPPKPTPPTAPSGVKGTPPPSVRPAFVNADEWAAMTPQARAEAVTFDRSLPKEPPSDGPIARGMVPPIPVPSPDEEVEGTLPGYVQRAAQAAGIALPLAALWWSRRKPTVGKPSPRSPLGMQEQNAKGLAAMKSKSGAMELLAQQSKREMEAPPSLKDIARDERGSLGFPKEPSPISASPWATPRDVTTLRRDQLWDAPEGALIEWQGHTYRKMGAGRDAQWAVARMPAPPYSTGSPKVQMDPAEGIARGQGHPAQWFPAKPPSHLRSVVRELDGPPTIQRARDAFTDERGSAGYPPEPTNRPPSVDPKYRTERVGPPSTPQPQKEAVKAGINEVRAQVKAATASPVGEGGPIDAPDAQGFNLAADHPGDPLPEATRGWRFFGRKKPWLFEQYAPPEEVVRGDPGGTAVVHLSIRRHSDGDMLKREMEDRAREVYRGLSREEVEQVNRVLDSEGVTPEQFPSLLPPRLAEVAERARVDIFDAGADATGLARERRITGYFPRLRDTVRVQETKMVLDPGGEAYLSKTYVGDVPKHIAPFFEKARTASDPASTFGMEGVMAYQRAVARALTMNGGFHPVTREVIPGFLNEVAPLLKQVGTEVQPYTARLVNYFLGVPGATPGTALGHQKSRIARNVNFARLIGGNLGSPIQNMTQITNTIAETGPLAAGRGLADMLDPARRALVKRWIGMEELSKADLESVQQMVTKMDTVENLTAKLAHHSGVFFRASEGPINRYHAFLSGMRQAEGYGLQGRDAIEFARDVVDRTQFPGTGPAKMEGYRGPIGAAFGQFKTYQTRQLFFFKRMVMEDWADFVAMAKGQKDVPLMVRGRQHRLPNGELAMRPLGTHGTQYIPMRRTATLLGGMALLGGPDAIMEGLDDWLEEQGIKIPGLLPALGAGIAHQMGFGSVTPDDVTRSLLFSLPGPLVGYAQDMASAVSGVDFGRGLTSLRTGGFLEELTPDQRADRILRSFPVAGTSLARGRQVIKQQHTPGEERMARTLMEAFGIDAATGPLLRRTERGDAARTLIGGQSEARQREGQERRGLGEMDSRAKKAIELAANDFAAGDRAAGLEKLRDAETRLKLRPGSLQVSEQAEAAARERRTYTPLERQRHGMRSRFPQRVRESKERAPGRTPPEPPTGGGLSIPRPRLR